MFVNKVFSYHTSPTFKAITPKVNDVGITDDIINYPHDKGADWSVDFYPGVYDDSALNRMRIITENGPFNIALQENGIAIPKEEIKKKFGHFDFLAYQLRYKGNVFADSGEKINADGSEYTFYDMNKTTPLVNGTGVLVMPRNESAGYSYDANGNIIYDVKKQKASEGVVRTYGNNGGGNLAGFEYFIPIHARDGKKVIVSTPFHDRTSNHGYWIENLMQPAFNLGNRDNIRNIDRKMFQFGMKRVLDCAYTSEGLHGVHFDRAINTTTSGMKPLEYYMFLIDGFPELSVIPQYNENIRFKIINPPVVWDEETQDYHTNPEYNSFKPTIINTYDSSQISDEQRQNTEEIIYSHEGQPKNPLEGNSYKSSVACGVFNINPEEYVHRLDALKKYNQANPQGQIFVDSAEGAKFIARFSNFSLATHTSGLSTWEAMNDILKRLYVTSPFLESLIARSSNPDAERNKYNIGMMMNQDVNLQHLQMEYRQHKNDSIIHIAQSLKDMKDAKTISETLINQTIPDKNLSAEEILKQAKPLPKEAEMTQDEIDNVLLGMYVDDVILPEAKDDKTLYALMQMSLGELELGLNTVALLSSPFFTNLATSEKTLGKTRYELMKEGNPQFNVDESCKDLIEPYAKNYKKMEAIYKKEIKEFADEVIKKVDEGSEEKLLDNDGNYTEYGERVIQLFAEDIMRYAVLKALCKDKSDVKLNADGTIHYDYDVIRENTNLEAFGIYTNDGTVQAEQLLSKLKSGLKRLSSDDVKLVSDSVAKRLENVTPDGLRLASAMYHKSGLAHDIRLDAAKDIVSWNEVAEGTMDVKVALNQIIKFYKKMLAEIKKYNPYANTIAEFTDMKDQDIAHILNVTKMNSVAAYSYFFTELMQVFSADFEKGSKLTDTAYKSAYGKLKNVMENIDAARNLYTFVDNHDKPSVLHGYALNMERFYGDFNDKDNRTLYALLDYNADKIEDLPIEARLNLDNPNFYMNASTRQLTMLAFIKDVMNDEVSKTLQEKDREYLKQALSDLMRGNYLDVSTGETSLQTTENPELATIAGAVTAILAIAKLKGLDLKDKPEDLIKIIEDRVKNDEKYVEYHKVWNIQDAKYVQMLDSLGMDSSDVQKYNPYVIGLTHLIHEELVKNLSTEQSEILKSAEAEFIEKHDAASTKSPHFMPNAELEMMKTALACKDFRTVITMLIKQAQYNANVKGDNSADILNSDHAKQIFCDMFKAMTEPAVQKTLMTMAYLEALPGMPTINSRDMLVGLGFETPSKNLYQASRGTTTWSELDDTAQGEFENQEFKDYIKKVYSSFQDVTRMRSFDGSEPMNNGTPYLLGEQESKVLASMMYNGLDDFVVTLFNTSGMDTSSRHDYGTDKKEGWISINPDNKYVPQQEEKTLSGIDIGLLQIPTDTELVNPLDNKVFVVKMIDGARKIVAKEGNIVLNKTTAPYGVMTLVKKTAKTVAFKGQNFNKQYHFNTNLYAKNEAPQEGTKLSIYSK